MYSVSLNMSGRTVLHVNLGAGLSQPRDGMDCGDSVLLLTSEAALDFKEANASSKVLKAAFFDNFPMIIFSSKEL
jgi:hypothetical protein